MIELLAENALLRGVLLLTLFALVAAGVYMMVITMSAREAMRRRLVDDGPRQSGETMMGSLRAEQAENSWFKLVNAIEKSGLSLVDTKDRAVRQKLIAAGFTSTHAP